MADTIVTAPLAAAQTQLPAYHRAYLVLPAPTIGAIRFAGLSGWSGGSSYSVPAGSSGLVKLPWGATGTVTGVALDNPADRSIGALVAMRVEPAPLNQIPLDPVADVLSAIPDRPTLSPGFAVRYPVGQVAPRAFASGYVLITGAPLSGTLTLSASGVFSQTLAAGTSGLVALSGATGAPLNYAFSVPSDAAAADVRIVGVLA